MFGMIFPKKITHLAPLPTPSTHVALPAAARAARATVTRRCPRWTWTPASAAPWDSAAAAEGPGARHGTAARWRDGRGKMEGFDGESWAKKMVNNGKLT